MIIYFLLILVGSLVAGRLILGELRKESRDYVVLIEPPSVSQEDFQNVSMPVSPAVQAPFIKVGRETQRQDEWERALHQKNVVIEKFTRDLENLRNQNQEFEKIKALLERQIFESRQMNRSVKQESDALKVQVQRSRDEISKLQMELNYKNQLLNQNELKMNELKNRISNVLPNTPTPSQEPAPKQELDLGEFSFDELDWRKKLTD
jgi:hypothetical protein